MKIKNLKLLLLISFCLQFLPIPLQAQPVWIQKSNYLGTARFDFTGFSLNGKGHFGGGRYAGPFNSISEWQTYNPDSDTWHIITPMTYPFTGLSGFEIGGTGYVMNGVNDAFYNDETLKYNQAGNNWSTGSFNPYTRLYAASTSNGTNGYFIGGYGFAAEPLNDIWEYNPVLDSWTAKDTLPMGAARYYATAFSCSGNIYLFGGMNDMGLLNDLWKFDTATTHWTQMTSMPAPERYQSLSFVINNEAYIIGGILNGSNTKEVWKYNALADSWTALPDFPGTNAPFGGAAFTINGKGYIVTGNGTTECWEFDPGITTICEEKNENLSLNLSPNPVVGISTLQIDGINNSSYTIVIMNSLGGIVKTINTIQSMTELDKDNFTTGIYYLKVISNRGLNASMKIIIN